MNNIKRRIIWDNTNIEEEEKDVIHIGKVSKMLLEEKGQFYLWNILYKPHDNQKTNLEQRHETIYTKWKKTS